MKESFLEELASYLLQKEANFEKTYLILPSKRAGTFFTKALAEISTKAILSPEILTVGDLLERLNPVKKLDKLSAIFYLYQCFIELKKEKNKAYESFDEFLTWGNNLLSDFGDVDRYLINTKDFFTYLNDAKAIELWNVDGSPLTPGEQDFIEFWQDMGELYHKFEQFNLQNQQLTASQLLKQSALNCAALCKNIPKNTKIYIAGLNALTPAEELIFKTLSKNISCEIIWDMDSYYISNENQEAGLFIRKHLDHFGQNTEKWLKQNFKAIPKEIDVVECNTKYAQVKAAADALLKVNENDTLKTAVILNDEDLLLPLLYALPENIQSANVTMGYALQNTPLANLVINLLDIWRKMKGSDEKGVYYYKEVFKLMDHPYALELFEDKNGIKKLKQQITEKNKIYISKNYLAQFLNAKVIDLCFPNAKLLNGKGINLQLLKILKLLKENIESKKDEQESNKSLKLEYLYHYTIALRKLNRVMDQFNFPFDVKSAKTLIQQLLNKEKIAFFGEPLAGIQIMGMLESRALDFDRVLMLSANEGTLPQGRKNQSFFPFDISKQFSLPTHHEQDAIFAYYFYRLIQKAQKVELFYFTGKDNLGGNGEPSRFIQQLEKELPNYQKDTIFKHKTYAPSPVLQKNEHKIIKDENLIAKTKAFLKSGMSPSALNTFLNCPQDFYYKYLLGLSEQEEIEENIGNASFGTALHDTLEELYKLKINQVLQISDIEYFEKEYPKILQQKFKENLSEDNVKTGFNRLQLEVAQNYLKQYFKKEKAFLTTLDTPYTVLALEKNLSYTLNMEVAGESIELKVKGKLDRLGKYGGFYHLVDYKSGNVSANDLNFKHIEDLALGKKNKAMQLQLYAYLLLMDQNYQNIVPCIFSLKNQQEGYMNLLHNKNIQSGAELKSATESVLQNIIEDMLDTKASIKHNANSLYCAYCL